jgi:hypothetical protein
MQIPLKPKEPKRLPRINFANLSIMRQVKARPGITKRDNSEALEILLDS